MSSYSQVVMKVLTSPKTYALIGAPAIGGYIGWVYDEAENQRMIRFRDRSALYGRPPPPEGVKEIPSW